MSLLRRFTLYESYLIGVSLLGASLAVLGIIQVPSYEPKLNFFLFILLGAVAQFATTSVPVANNAGITYAIAPAVSMATIPFFGPAAATLVEAITSVSIWLIKSEDQTTWKRNWQQLAFNTGMSSMAMFIAGWIFIVTQHWLGADTILGQTIPWLVAAVVNDQVNLWLLIGVLRLQQGKVIDPLVMWQEELWATQISIPILAIGGGLLAFATQQFGWLGIVIFFFPILLSAYAFRLYVQQMQAHMDNLEAIVAERTEALETVNREKDAFLAVLTHDMKSPLNSIGLAAEMLDQYPNILSRKPRLIRSILRSQQTLVDLVNNILDLEKLEAGGSIALKTETLDLVKIVHLTLDAAYIQAETKGLKLNFSAHSQPLLIKGDMQQLERVLLNLLSNSMKYSPSGKHIDVTIGCQNQKAMVIIEDHGYGIPADDLPYIFDRFRRVKKHEQLSAGTGLGLAISKAIVEAHSGTIVATSEEGVGSRFTIELPLAKT